MRYGSILNTTEKLEHPRSERDSKPRFQY